ncbi:unnamed protein product [Owenia fusiformis]|nr:unnamed protein product [Owenia fusiformis]
MDYETGPWQYRFRAYAKERPCNSWGNCESEVTGTVEVTLNIQDINDNAPFFQLATYVKDDQLETVGVGSTVMQVSAKDIDSGLNGQLVYSMDHGNFSIKTEDNAGIITTKTMIDYDLTPLHMYQLNIGVTDSAPTNPRTATTMVQVNMRNENDNAPQFVPPEQTIRLNQQAPRGTLVAVLQAYDLDGDRITYEIRSSNSPTTFNLDPNTGHLTTRQPLSDTIGYYYLNITARDDGSCCSGSSPLTGEGYIVVEIYGLNTPPRFPNCANYAPSVKEDEPIGSWVMQLTATDSDVGDNGRLEYSLVIPSGENERFRITSLNGNLTTAQVFKRREGTKHGVTARVEDFGRPRLSASCFFFVTISDVNNHDPVFDQREEYVVAISRNHQTSTRVLRVLATDLDEGNNGQVTYSITSQQGNYFTIDSSSGWITLQNSVNGVGGQTLSFTVSARDNGSPQRTGNLVTVEVVVTSSTGQEISPTWTENYDDQTAIKFREDVLTSYLVKSLKATPYSTSAPAFTYSLPAVLPSRTIELNGLDHFSSSANTTDMSVRPSGQPPLDYEENYEFLLKCRAATQTYYMDTRLQVELTDVNNKIPKFQGRDNNGRYTGSIPITAGVNYEVMRAVATDEDGTLPNNRVYYYLLQQGDYTDFAINEDSGVVTSLRTFNTTKLSFALKIGARDGANSALPGVTGPNEAEPVDLAITIVVLSSGKPEFTTTPPATTIPETTVIGTSLLTVRAADSEPDNVQYHQYAITGGNTNQAFGVVPNTGDIYVRGKLDYATTQSYNLAYRVFDGAISATTTVVMNIQQQNKRPPVITPSNPSTGDVVEMDTSTVGNGREMLLYNVTAINPDTGSSDGVQLGVQGYKAAEQFRIDPQGRVYLTNWLDRDEPYGFSTWDINIVAQDQNGGPDSLTTYGKASVSPKDINDHSPIFKACCITGSVPEGAAPSQPIMTVSAGDVDFENNGTVCFNLRDVPTENGNPLFSLDGTSGQIRSLRPLNRENQDRYEMIVDGMDRGVPARTTSTKVYVVVADINDNRPEFAAPKSYYKEVPEELPLGATCMEVSATDNDIGENAKLTFSIVSPDSPYFYFDNIHTTQTGIVKIKSRVDYEAMSSHLLQYNIRVQDPNPSNSDTAVIHINITDINDNAPVFNPATISTTQSEDIPVGTTIATFSATDRDSGVNAQFDYSIDYMNNRPDAMHFEIDPQSGVVTTMLRLDRENIATHNVHILAIDKGTPTMTGTGTLILTLTDVNDNFPQFAEDYQPIAWENEPPVQDVVTIRGKDADTSPNGPPYLFALPCGETCPCNDNPTCPQFSMNFRQGGDSGRGEGDIRTKVTLDREQQKYYRMPIIMSDSGNPRMTGTNTLTVTVGDRNDNDHRPGHKEVYVYNYKGELSNADLGHVYAEDPDDWDRGDKTFSFEGTSADHSRFTLDASSGILRMLRGTGNGVYNLRVRVRDTVRNVEAVSTIRVNVQEIYDDAVYSSGSIRFAKMTQEQFIERNKTGTGVEDYGKSRSTLLAEQIATMLSVPVGNVHIFSVRDNATNTTAKDRQPNTHTDVRFAAHGSPWYRTARLDGLVLDNKEQIQTALGGAQIAMVPIDECYQSDWDCHDGGCSSLLRTTTNAHTVNTNATSLVGVDAFLETTCSCKARDFESPTQGCGPMSCLNNGTCHDIPRGETLGNSAMQGFYCECLADFDGPRCQQTRHSFTGNGYAWYKRLAPQCQDTTLSLEFMTSQDNGLLLYNGPWENVNANSLDNPVPQDFISVELEGGYPKVRLDLGTGAREMRVQGRDLGGNNVMPKLSDGKWHKIDIIKIGQKVHFVVDSCAQSVLNSSAPWLEDRTPCQSPEVEFTGLGMYLTLYSPLELGGRSKPQVTYPQGLTTTGFNGCIKNVYNNGELYDLHIGNVGQHSNTADRCPAEDSACGVNLPSGPRCGGNGTCIGEIGGGYVCDCRPGFRGPGCNIETQPRDYKPDSYIQWDFKEPFYRDNIQNVPRNTGIQLMFRTRVNSGALFVASNEETEPAYKRDFLLDIVDKKLRFTHRLGPENRELWLKDVDASDGAWHSVSVNRAGKILSLQMDGGDGPYYNETLGMENDTRTFEIKLKGLYGGAVRLNGAAQTGIEGCLNDVRYNKGWFPMDSGQNSISNAAEVQYLSSNVGSTCNAGTPCTGITCPNGLICLNRWRDYECGCQEGYQRVDEGGTPTCIPVSCLANPCLNGGVCVPVGSGYSCECTSGWRGKNCDIIAIAAVGASLSTGAWVAMLVCFLMLLLLILLLVLITRTRNRPPPLIDDMDDVRENVMYYDEDGAGEEDMEGYDLARLAKPVYAEGEAPIRVVDNRPVQASAAPPPSGDNPDVGGFLNGRLGDADDDPNAPPFDSIREYEEEGEGSLALSLSSLGSGSSGDQDYNYLNDWGPKFTKLADMYNE